MNWDPTKWDQDPNKWGSAGLIWNGGKDPRGLTDGRSGNGWNFDPRYVQQDQYAGSEGNGGQNFYQPTDHFNKLFDNGNQVQVRDIKRLKDQNAVKWGGDEVGWLTGKDNYTDDTDWVDKAFEYGGMAMLAGPTMLHALGIPQGSWSEFSNHFGGNQSGLSGGDLPHGTEMPNTYSPNANPTSFYEPLGPGPESGFTGGDLPHGTEMPNTYSPGVDPSPLGATPGASGGLLSGGLEGLLGGLLKNPLQLAGLLPLVSGLIGGGNTGAPTGGAPGESGGLLQLPKGNRGAWTPNAHTAGQISNFKWAGR